MILVFLLKKNSTDYNKIMFYITQKYLPKKLKKEKQKNNNKNQILIIFTE